jgi:hypothetical protein
VTATVRTWDHSFACGIHDDQTAMAERAKREAVVASPVRERRGRGSDLVTYLAALSIFVLTVIVARLVLGWAMA